MKNILAPLLITITVNCFSQENKNNDIRDITKINFFDPGISYEKRIGKFQSLHAQVFLSTSIYIGYSSALGNTSGIDAYPALGLQYRYYYNYSRRSDKGKRTEMNSLNYVCGLAQTSFYKDEVSQQQDRRTLSTAGIAWGLQRNYPSRFSLDLILGLGYVFTKETIIDNSGQYATRNTGEITNIGQISLGFWLNKRD